MSKSEKRCNLYIAHCYVVETYVELPQDLDPKVTNWPGIEVKSIFLMKPSTWGLGSKLPALHKF